MKRPLILILLGFFIFGMKRLYANETDTLHADVSWDEIARIKNPLDRRVAAETKMHRELEKALEKKEWDDLSFLTKISIRQKEIAEPGPYLLILFPILCAIADQNNYPSSWIPFLGALGTYNLLYLHFLVYGPKLRDNHPLHYIFPLKNRLKPTRVSY